MDVTLEREGEKEREGEEREREEREREEREREGEREGGCVQGTENKHIASQSCYFAVLCGTK